MQLKDLNKRYGNKTVLGRFSLELPDGGTFALLGPSGCGKTTLLRLIAGLEKPDSGAVHIRPESRIAMVFQEDRLIPGLTARDNVLAVMKKSGDAPSRALELLRLLEMEAAAGERPVALSGGMKRRVALARALACGGDILLLDEPFKGLDAKTKELAAETVFDPGRSAGRLTLLVTHDHDEAYRYADRILLLEGIPLRVCGEK